MCWGTCWGSFNYGKLLSNVTRKPFYCPIDLSARCLQTSQFTNTEHALGINLGSNLSKRIKKHSGKLWFIKNFFYTAVFSETDNQFYTVWVSKLFNIREMIVIKQFQFWCFLGIFNLKQIFCKRAEQSWKNFNEIFRATKFNQRQECQLLLIIRSCK